MFQTKNTDLSTL